MYNFILLNLLFFTLTSVDACNDSHADQRTLRTSEISMAATDVNYYDGTQDAQDALPYTIDKKAAWSLIKHRGAAAIEEVGSFYVHAGNEFKNEADLEKIEKIYVYAGSKFDRLNKLFKTEPFLEIKKREEIKQFVDEFVGSFIRWHRDPSRFSETDQEPETRYTIILFEKGKKNIILFRMEAPMLKGVTF